MQFGGDMTNRLAQVGQFCPNEQCELYGEIEAAQIIRFGKTKKRWKRPLLSRWSKLRLIHLCGGLSGSHYQTSQTQYMKQA